MRKRWIFLALASALALVVLTAGLAYASSRWDDQHRSQTAVTSQVTTRSQQQAPQPIGTCDGTAAREPTRAQQATHDNDCAGLADEHASAAVGGTQTAQPAAATAAATSQPARDRDRQRDHDRDQSSAHDGRCANDSR